MSNTKISTEQGSIYFIREQNLITKNLSPFVKIGLTALHRRTTDRRNDLQTGNPRELFIAHEVVVPCVRAVETALRYKFLEQNVNLEWHIFSENSKNQIEDAFIYCEELKNRFTKYTPLIEEAKRLDNTKSEGNAIPASEEAAYWQNEIQLHHEIIKICKRAFIAQRSKAKKCFENGEQLPHGTAIRQRIVSEIEWDQLINKYPSVVEKYLKIRLSGVFRLSGKRAQNNGEANLRVLQTESEVEKFFELFDTEKNHADPSPELRRQQIRLQQLAKFSSVEKEIARCHLKAICGTAPGISNICTWVRQLSPPRLDKQTLAKDHKTLLIPFTYNKIIVTAILKRTAGEMADNLRAEKS